jgi:hypothetical protein
MGERRSGSTKLLRRLSLESASQGKHIITRKTVFANSNGLGLGKRRGAVVHLRHVFRWAVWTRLIREVDCGSSHV